MKKIKGILSNVLCKFEKVYYTLVLSIVINSSLIGSAYASQPKLVSGTVNLFKAISGWLLLIIPVGAGAVLGYHALQKSLTDDQAIIAEKNKLMKNVIIGAAIAVTASGLVNIILGFYS